MLVTPEEFAITEYIPLLKKRIQTVFDVSDIEIDCSSPDDIQRVKEKDGYVPAIVNSLRGWEYGMSLYNTNFRLTDTVLDVGGACSTFMFYLATLVKEVICIDECGFDAAQEWLNNISYFDQYVKTKVIVSNARELPFEDNSFDRVVTFSALEHFVNGEDILVAKEIYRVLKDDGIFCGTVDFNPVTEHPQGLDNVCRTYTYTSLFNRIIFPTNFKFVKDPIFKHPLPETVNYIASPIFFQLRK